MAVRYTEPIRTLGRSVPSQVPGLDAGRCVVLIVDPIICFSCPRDHLLFAVQPKEVKRDLTGWGMQQNAVLEKGASLLRLRSERPRGRNCNAFDEFALLHGLPHAGRRRHVSITAGTKDDDARHKYYAGLASAYQNAANMLEPQESAEAIRSNN